MKYITGFILLWLLLFSHIQAQNFPYTHYTTKDGLVNSSVFCCYQDHQGFMWFGTENGVSRFDGYSFKNYTVADGLPGNIVLSIAEDSNHTLYFGTKAQGIAKFKNDSFSIVYPDSMGIQYNNYMELCDNKSYSLNSGSGLVITDLKTKKIIKTFLEIVGDKPSNSRYFRCLKKLKNNDIVIGSNTGLYKVIKDSIVKLNIEVLNNLHISVILQKNDTIYVSSKKMLYKLTNWKVFDSIKLGFIANKEINNMLIDYRNAIWVTTKSSNIFRYENNVSLYDINSSMQLLDLTMSCIYEDKEKNIWICTNNNGIYCVNNSYIKIYNDGYVISRSYVTSLAKLKKNEILIGTSNGMFAFFREPIQFKILLSSNNGATPFYIHCIKAIDSNKVIVSQTGSGTSTQARIFRDDLTFFAIFNSPICIKYNNDTFLKGDYHGKPYLALLENNNVINTRQLTLQNNVNSIKTKCIYQSTNKITYIGTNKGLFYLNASYKIFKYSNNILCSSINCIKENKTGEIWIGTDQGIAIEKNGKFTFISEYNRIHLRSITSLTFDNNNNICVSTPKNRTI